MADDKPQNPFAITNAARLESFERALQEFVDKNCAEPKIEGYGYRDIVNFFDSSVKLLVMPMLFGGAPVCVQVCDAIRGALDKLDASDSSRSGPAGCMLNTFSIGMLGFAREIVGRGNVFMQQVDESGDLVGDPMRVDDFNGGGDPDED